ncbi:hypothetical protein JHW45_01490 [Paracoccus stylophorae]|uniref:Capsule polysaccharide biosynthesis protein n=1 Tax=Paracoccus stylophorae TaxID=659350 RepID=A0ABY7SW04_9RHOB|nr:hypothetical protein [Paracoccus stylophorae]WCR11111.1 hypothetical protein JHW45_01490 [Paracoccus stylophorae]
MSGGHKRRIVALEVPEAWFRNPDDGPRHRQFYASLLAALAEMRVLVDPIWLPRGADRAPRRAPCGSLVISFHSHGEAGNVLRCKEAYVPPYYTMDRMGYACFSELGRFPDRFRDEIARQDDAAAQAFLDALAADLRRTNQSKYPQPPSQPCGLGERHVFVPLQMQNDSVAQAQWLDVPQALETIIAGARQRGLKTVIKRHPRCHSPRIAELVERLRGDPDVIVSTASIHDLIRDAELVVGANSGAMFEALLFGRPVIAFAGSDFGLAVQQVRSARDLAAAVAAPAPPDPAWRRKFLYWYLTSYCVRADDTLAIRRRIQAFEIERRTGPVSRRAARLSLYGYSIWDRVKKRLF